MTQLTQLNLHQKNMLIALKAICFDTIEFKAPKEPSDMLLINLSSKVVGDLYAYRTNVHGWLRIVCGGHAFHVPSTQDHEANVELAEALCVAAVAANRVRIQTSTEVRQYEGGPCISIMSTDIVANSESFHAININGNSPFGNLDDTLTGSTPGRYQKLAYLNMDPRVQSFRNLALLDDDSYLAFWGGNAMPLRMQLTTIDFVPEPTTFEIRVDLFDDNQVVTESMVKRIHVCADIALFIANNKPVLSINDPESGGIIVDLSHADVTYIERKEGSPACLSLPG